MDLSIRQKSCLPKRSEILAICLVRWYLNLNVVKYTLEIRLDDRNTRPITQSKRKRWGRDTGEKSPCSLNPSWQLCPDIPDDQTVSESIHLPVRLRCPFLWKTKRQKHNRLPSALAPADGRVQAAQRQNRPFVRSAVLPAGARTIVSPLTPAYPRVKGVL